MDGLIKKLKALAVKEVPTDDPDFLVCDYAGGNIDDAYGIGVEVGEVLLARRLLKEFAPAAS